MEPEAGHVVVTGSLAPTHANGYAWKGYFSGHPDTRHCWYVDGRYFKNRETSFDLVARLPDEPEPTQTVPGCTDYCVGHGQHSPYCPHFVHRISADVIPEPTTEEPKTQTQRFGNALEAMLDGKTVRIYSNFRIVDGVLEASVAGEPWKRAEFVNHDAILSDKWEIL